MPSKPIWQSWTLWFNVAAAIYQALDLNGAFLNLSPQTQAAIVVLGNVLLRFKTTQPVTIWPIPKKSSTN